MTDDELVAFCKEAVTNFQGWYGWTTPFAVDYVIARVGGASHDEAFDLAVASSRVTQADKSVVA